jgi:hypothetical protein
MPTQRFYISTSVANDFNKLIANLGLVKKFWYKAFFFHEMAYMNWAYDGAAQRDFPPRNSDVAHAFLQRKQTGKVSTFPKKVKLIYCDMPVDDVELYKNVCAFFNVSHDALMEFALKEALSRVRGVKFRNRGIPDSYSLFFLKYAITDKPLYADKVFRIKEALFCDDGVIPNSFKSEFRKKNAER